MSRSRSVFGRFRVPASAPGVKEAFTVCFSVKKLLNGAWAAIKFRLQLQSKKAASDRLRNIAHAFESVFFVAIRPFCAPWAYLYIISGAGVVSGTPHPAV